MKSKILFAGLALSVAIFGCSRNENEIGGSGLIETDEVTVSAETSGRIDSLFFDEGDLLSTGDTLVVIDPSRLELQLASLRAAQNVAKTNLATARVNADQADSRLKYAESEFKRIQTLAASGTASQQQLDKQTFDRDQAAIGARAARAQVSTVQAEIERTDADINRLLRQLQDCYPTSPLQGTVTEKFVEAGELISPGRSLARIANLLEMWVKIYLPTAEFADVKVGDKATVSTESGEQTYEGTVIWTSSEAEFTPKNVQTAESRAGLVYAVKIRVVNTDSLLKIGMPVYATLESR